MATDSQCKVNFHSNFCVIEDINSKAIRGVGKEENGLYYLINNPLQQILSDLKKIMSQHNTETHGGKAMNADTTLTMFDLPATISNAASLSETTLWHHRLGHAPLKKIGTIPSLTGFVDKCNKVCLTCPMAKFTKLP